MKIAANTHIVEAALVMGLCTSENGDAVLIDSGLEAQTAKKALRLAEEIGANIRGIVNTHSHADHCGGNAFFQEKLGVSVFASEIEAAIIENPDIEGIYLYGACPPPALRTKFVRALPTKGVVRLADGLQNICGLEFNIVCLPGHMPGHIGAIFGDTLFFGDALAGEYVWDKYKLIFLTDISKAIETCDIISNLNLRAVGVHTGLVDDVVKLAKFNKSRMMQLADELVSEMREPIGRELLLGAFAKKHGLQVSGSQFFLLLATVSAYMTYLLQVGAAECIEQDGILKYKRI